MTNKYLPIEPLAWLTEIAHLSRAARSFYVDLLVLCSRATNHSIPDNRWWVERMLSCADHERDDLQAALRELIYRSGCREHRWLERSVKVLEGKSSFGSQEDEPIAYRAIKERLQSIEALRDFPVSRDNDIQPIWNLIREGYSLHEVVCGISAQAMNNSRVFKKWAYFVEGIIEQRSKVVRIGASDDDELPF